MHLFQPILIATGIFIATYLPGRALLSFFRLNDDEKFAGSFGISFFIYYLIGFTGYILNQNALVFNLGFLLSSLIVSIYLLLKKQEIFRQEINKSIIFFLCFLVILYFQTFLPIYSGGLWSFDWWEHYQRAIFFLDRLPPSTHFGPYLLTARPPVFNVVCFFFQSIAGRDFWVFQIISTLLNLTIFLPCYLLVKHFFREKSKFLFAFVVLILLLNPSIIIQTTFTWSKAMAAGYILLGLVFYLRFRDAKRPMFLYLTALFIGMGQITHYSSATYLIIIILDLIFQKIKNSKVSWRVLFNFTGIFLIIVSSWYLWAILNLGFSETFFGNTTFKQQNYSSVFQIIGKETNNSIKTLFPVLSPGYLRYINTERSFLVRTYDETYALYATTIPGQVTFTLVFVLWFMWRKIKFKNYFLLYFCISGFILGILVIPKIEPTGLAHVTLLPVSCLLLSLAIGLLFSLRKSRLFYLFLVCIGIEAVIGIGLRLYIFQHDLKPSYFMKNRSAHLVEEHRGNYLLKEKSNLIFLSDL
jgi:hypothetical protein